MLRKKEGDNLRDTKSIRTKYINYFLIILIIFILTFIAFYLASSDAGYEKIPICGDGTFYNTCSLTKPYFCDNGTLIEKASVCGCNKNLQLSKENEYCISKYNTNPIDIQLNYLLNGQQNEINFVAFEGIYNNITNISRVIYYENFEIPFRANFKLQSINNELQKEMLLPLVKKIQNIAPYDKVEQARIAVGLVQNIPYNFSQKIDLFENESINHSRYPYEVLYDNSGICGEKSLLLAFLLKELGYSVSIFYFANENHEAVGIKCPLENSFYGSGYCFIETSGPSIISDFSMEFTNGIKLTSMPEILLISDGISLPENIDDYKDAITLNNIRDQNLWGILNFWKLNKIKEKYGLTEAYELE